MLGAKTVFVIGAGASNEVGLPVGRDLRKLIYKKLDFRADRFGRRDPNYGDERILEAIRRCFHSNANAYIHACHRIREGVLLSASIDDFIDVHRDDKDIAESGKLAIARTILEAERASLLYFDNRNQRSLEFQKIEDTWYTGFFRLLHERLSKSSRAKIFENATVVSFNYDRCLEHFLVHALMAHYQIDRQEARELVNQLTIIHPYGTVGNLLAAEKQIVSFGSDEPSDLDVSINNLKTYTEEVADKSSLERLHRAIVEARVLVFLGNNFHPNNLKLLTPDQGTLGRKKIYATRLGISDPDLQVVVEMLVGLSGNTSKHIPSPEEDYHFCKKCADLFHEFHMSLRQ